MQLYNGDAGGTSPSFNPFNNLGEEHNDNSHRAQKENDQPGFTLDDLKASFGEFLNPEHLRMLLQESDISPEAVRARGYRTVETKAELRRLGFADSQCNTPGLLIPIYSPAGDISNYQFRPDQPRIREGKPIRYETPRGTRMVLDVHPSAREKLGDPSVPLFVTEGVKKGDALVSRGLCVVSLLGVWNWRGTNEHGGTVILPEWEYVALNSRKVYIVFDSDVMTKPQVNAALTRLKAFLEGRGAEVALIYLPPYEGGAKQGVDDFLASGNSVEDLRALATTELREPPREEEEEDDVLSIPYRETPYGLGWDKPTKEGFVSTLLTNFTARITSDLVEDDGAEETRAFEIEAEIGGRRSIFTIPSEQFSGMNWVPEHLGAGAIMYAGFGLKDHARAAIQMLSGDIPTRHVYAHTGWRKIDGEWVYLHGGGPIGPIPGIEVSLGNGRIGDYLLPDPPTGEDLVQAIRTSLRFLELAPPRIAVPLFAALFRAPLGEMLPVDLSVFLAGPTGVYKTELSAMVQAHYGAAFNGRYLPANWSSTENALEKQAFAAKDAILTVDDFAPTGTNYDIQRLHRTADRLLRAQGNRSGRGRMQADTSLRAVFYPRGLLLASGEDIPRGQSLRSRLAVLELSPGEVELEVLSDVQQGAAQGLLASAMSGYLQWLAPQMEDLKEKLPQRQRELRARAAGVGTHARTPDIVASLTLGIETFLEFSAETKAITGARAEELWGEAWEALGEMAESQPEHQGGEEPTQQFLELLTAAVVSGRAHVADAKTGRAPDNPEHWGWRDTLDEWRPQGNQIGWLKSDESLLLERNAAFAAAQKLARDQGTNLPITQRVLWKRMAEKGLLASRDARGGRNTTRTKIAGERKTVVHLIAGLLSKNGPIGPNDPSPGEKGDSGPKDGADSSTTQTETARENGPNLAETGPSGPKGPIGPFPGEGPTEKVEGIVQHLPNGKAHLVDTQAGVQDLLPELRQVERVALDLETTGLDPRRHKVRLLTLATEGGTWIVDCFEVDPHPLFPVLAEKKLLIHNAFFDLSFLSQMGFEMSDGGEIIDTMLTSQLLGDEQTKDKEDV